MSYTGTVEILGQYNHYVDGKRVTATALKAALEKFMDQVIADSNAIGKLSPVLGTLRAELDLVNKVLNEKKSNKPAPKRSKTKEAKMAKKEQAQKGKEMDTRLQGEIRYVAGNKDTFVVQGAVNQWLYCKAQSTGKIHRIRKDLALKQRPEAKAKAS